MSFVNLRILFPILKYTLNRFGQYHNNEFTVYNSTMNLFKERPLSIVTSKACSLMLSLPETSIEHSSIDFKHNILNVLESHQSPSLKKLFFYKLPISEPLLNYFSRDQLNMFNEPYHTPDA